MMLIFITTAESSVSILGQEYIQESVLMMSFFFQCLILIISIQYYATEEEGEKTKEATDTKTDESVEEKPAETSSPTE